MKNRNVAIGLLVVFGASVFLAILVVAVAAAFFIYSFDLQDMEGFEDPEILSELGVHVGDAPIQKTDAFENGTLTRITDIRVGDYLDRPGQEIAVVSSEGAVFTDLEWSTVHTVEFSRSLDHVDLVALPASGEFRFINRASWSDDAAFIDADGSVIWEYGVMMGVNDMAAGDLDADGELDFVVGSNGSGGLHRVNIDGKRVWKKAGANLWHAEIVDVDGTGIMRIVHSNAGGELVIRDAEGKQIRSSQPPGYFASFSLCAWPDSDGIAYPFFCRRGHGVYLELRWRNITSTRHT